MRNNEPESDSLMYPACGDVAVDMETVKSAGSNLDGRGERNDPIARGARFSAGSLGVLHLGQLLLAAGVFLEDAEDPRGRAVIRRRRETLPVAGLQNPRERNANASAPSLPNRVKQHATDLRIRFGRVRECMRARGDAGRPDGDVVRERRHRELGGNGGYNLAGPVRGGKIVMCNDSVG